MTETDMTLWSAAFVAIFDIDAMHRTVLESTDSYGYKSWKVDLRKGGLFI